MTNVPADPIRVAFQGEHGAFSEEAANQLVAAQITAVPFPTFDQMFESVSSGRADCLIAPIENSLAGSIHQNYDLMMQYDFTIVGEIKLRIVHNLIAARGENLDGIQRVYSHPVALAQCERFLRAHPSIKVEAAYDTAGSVKLVMEKGVSGEAAIAGRAAAAIYGADIICTEIEDNPKNFTRFLLLASPESSAAIPVSTDHSRMKTSIVFRIANQPSALFRALAAFSLRDVDLTKLESRPIEGRPWEYSFYLDLAGDLNTKPVSRAIAHLGEMTESIRILGCYPGAVETVE